MTIIEQIKTEIERRIALYSLLSENTVNPNRIDEDRQLLSFISTLESEKPNEGLEEEIKQEVGDKRLCETMLYPYECVCDIARHFANWQKEQMTGGAVEVIAVAVNFDSATVNIPVSDLKQGDTVKLIIVKED